jgi:predicted dehydrogenase
MIKAACIGTGGISGVHLKYLKSQKDVSIAGLCDINPASLKKRVDEFGGEPFSDFRTMIDKVKPDAVWLCTPPQVRGEPLLLCAKKGIPVMCEKPVEREVKNAREINASLKRLKAKVQVGYVLRAMPIVANLQKAMADDKIHFIQSMYCCDMALARTFPAWFFDKKISGGALIDQATHNLDLIRVLMGEVAGVSGFASNPVTAKKGKYTIDETISLSYLFKSKAVGGHLHSWVGDTWRIEMMLSGEKRKYYMNIFGGTLDIEEKGKQTHFENGSRPLHDHENELFLAMVRSGKWNNNMCTYEEGLRTLELTIESDRVLVIS